MTALMDGDVFVYHAAYSSEQDIEWDNFLVTRHVFLNEAIDKIEELMDDALSCTEHEDFVIALSDPVNNWRKDVMPTYKEFRKKSKRPIAYMALREYLQQEHTTYEKPGMEGDDVLGILATHPTMHGAPTEKTIVSIDKDMRTLPCVYYNYVNRIGQEVSQHEADLFHMIQSLAGDATDGYSGCPSWGMVKAERLLTPLTPEEWWPAIVETYATKGLSEEVALQNARVARICRTEDYDFETRTVRLWEPPFGRITDVKSAVSF